MNTLLILNLTIKYLTSAKKFDIELFGNSYYSMFLCKSRNWESGNGMRGMRGIGVGMQGIGWECPKK